MSTLRGRPRLFVVVLVMLVGLAAWAGGHFWFDWQMRAAERAYHKDDVPEAIRHVGLALLVAPTSFEANLLAARLERTRNEYASAEAYLERCKEIGGTSERLQLEWLLLRAQAGEARTLRDGLKRCLEDNDPDSIWILEVLARCEMRELRLHSAHAYLEEWLRRDPDNLRALSLRGWARERMEYIEGAFDDCVDILKLDPERWDIRTRLVGYLLTARKMKEAEEHLNVIRKEHAAEPQVQIHWGQLCSFQGRLDEARKAFDAVILQRPDDTRALLERGKIDLQEGRPGDAEPFFRKAIKSDAGNLEAYYSLYLSLHQNPARRKLARAAQADYHKAREDFQNLKKALENLEKSPNDIGLMVETGGIFLRRGNPTIGTQFLKRALGMSPHEPKVHALLAAHYESEGNKEEAEWHRKQALARAR